MAQFRSFARPFAIVVSGLLALWFVSATTMERVFARRAPALALTWNPNSAEGNSRLADALLVQSTGEMTGEITERAARSVVRQPVNPAAARLLGVAAATRREGARADQLIRYSEAMSRRDFQTQLLLIEANVARGDVARALVHYDRALKTSAQGRSILFPILVQAANDPAIWRPLAVTLAQRPQWWRPFMDGWIPRSTSADALYWTARRTGIDRGPGADTALLQATEKRLVDLRAYSRAADLFNRAHGLPPGTAAPLRNGGFEQPGGWDPFEWNLIDEPDLAAVRQSRPGGSGMALFLTALNGRGGDLATQLVLLRPGRYVVTAVVGGVGGDPLAFPRVLVRCAADGRELLNAPFPAAGDGGKGWRSEFIVPAGCAGQRVIIRGSSSLDPSTTSPWVDDLSIRPVRK